MADDNGALGIVNQICAGALPSDFASGNDTAAARDINAALGYANNMSDPDIRQQALGLIAPFQTKLANLTPDQSAAAQTAFAATTADLTANAAALNNDPTYIATEGNLTSNQQSAAANAASGASNNFLNMQSFDAGLSTWVQQGGLKAVLNASVTGDQKKAPSLSGFFGSIGGKYFMIIAAVAVVGVIGYAKLVRA